MRIVEQCPCGGSIELAFTTDSLSLRARQEEQVEAHKQLDTWRRAHKPCLKRLGEPPAAAPAARGTG